ncbi:WYL domain-containing protein [Pseudomonas sp. PB120]|uniref:helix-turn-helix transcriptional regulator n=1 Tax=Pseudomonas sp. PB120 TaxID=2494700 RepID=UPI0012FD12F0|nr:WYL domain-containing protein [Pseudomonas sp. PB120]MVV49899.1 WYL domain-containing protein [Pseudomonas sp. PB120]
MAGSKYTAPDRERRRAALRKLLQGATGAQKTEALHSALESQFGPYSIRTTRRDLVAMAGRPEWVKPVPKNPNAKSLLWAVGRGSVDLTLSPMECMTLTAIFQHADRFGFRSDTEDLAKLRAYASTEVGKKARRDLVAEGRITTGTRFTVLKPGEYKEEHLRVIQEALLDGTLSLDVVYRPRDAGAAETCWYRLKPLALSYQDSNIYLTALVHQEQWPEGLEPTADAPRGKYSSNGPGKTCALMLHRMTEVKTYWQDIPELNAHDVRSVEVQKDLMTIHSDGPIEIELTLSDNLHNRLSENPLAEGQVMVPSAKGWRLTCQIADTQGLRLFLLSNAADIQVVNPRHLRDHVRSVLKQALEIYDSEL